jgi:cytochrome c556
MEQALMIVIFVVVGLGAVIGVASFAGSRRAYEEIGAGGIEADPLPRTPDSRAGAAEREAEIRQMLEARNARRLRRGEEPVDIEAELAHLTVAAVQADPELEQEVRQLVVARNARRVRRGEEPLDVEAEVRRQLEALG